LFACLIFFAGLDLGLGPESLTTPSAFPLCTFFYFISLFLTLLFFIIIDLFYLIFEN
jgi:hypothetical protein